jgi:ABC-type transport system involved in multi-copper enzyme maturation permease subunit
VIAVARQAVAIGRLDFGEVRRSRWLGLATIVYVLVASVLVLAGARESAVIGFGGMSRVMLSFVHVLLLVLPLLALAATTQVVNRARDDGTIELLFSHPLSREGWFLAVTVTRYLTLVVPLVVVFCVMAVVSLAFGDSPPWAMIGRSIAVSATLSWAFIGLGLAISASTRHPTKAIVLGLAAWALSIAILDLALVGLLLQWRVDARALFVLASLNPVQSARPALLSGIETDLGTLGPVGFFLAHRLGPGVLFSLGLLWPLLFGGISWVWALARFRRGDLV